MEAMDKEALNSIKEDGVASGKGISEKTLLGALEIVTKKRTITWQTKTTSLIFFWCSRKVTPYRLLYQRKQYPRYTQTLTTNVTTTDMKKTIKTFVGRLRDAWSIIRGDDYIFVSYEKGVDEQYARYTASLISGVRWFIKNNSVSIYPRIDMLQDLLSSGNSIMMLTKDADGTLTYCYDCKSEEDFNDLISMEVK